MILDDLNNINKYVAIHPRFEKAFAYLSATDFEKIKPEFTSWYRGSHIAILSSSDIDRICKPQPNLCIEH